MTVLRLTKNELRNQQTRLTQLNRYLPTLQLKKAMLQSEMSHVQQEIAQLQTASSIQYQEVKQFSSFLAEKVDFHLALYADVKQVKKKYENIAGIEIPFLEEVLFHEPDYFLFDTPVWSESATQILRAFVLIREKINVALEKKRAIEKELREVSIRVNLFEKILIPRARENISKIRIFLGDQELSSIATAKVAKAKLMAQREAL